jgi:hypothetical protein
MSGALARARARWADRVHRALDRGRATEVHLEGMRTWSGWVVRVAAGAVGAALVVLAWLGATGTGAAAHRASGAVATAGLVVGLVLAGIVVLWPGPGWAGGVLVVAGLLVLLGPAPGTGMLAALVLAAHGLVVASLLAARLTWRGRVEVAVVVVAFRGALPVQAGAQALAVVAGLVTLAVGDGAVGIGPADMWRAGALLAAAGAVLLLPRDPGGE